MSSLTLDKIVEQFCLIKADHAYAWSSLSTTARIGALLACALTCNSSNDDMPVQIKTKNESRRLVTSVLSACDSHEIMAAADLLIDQGYSLLNRINNSDDFFSKILYVQENLIGFILEKCPEYSPFDTSRALNNIIEEDGAYGSASGPYISGVYIGRIFKAERKCHRAAEMFNVYQRLLEAEELNPMFPAVLFDELPDQNYSKLIDFPYANRFVDTGDFGELYFFTAASLYFGLLLEREGMPVSAQFIQDVSHKLGADQGVMFSSLMKTITHPICPEAAREQQHAILVLLESGSFTYLDAYSDGRKVAISGGSVSHELVRRVVQNAESAGSLPAFSRNIASGLRLRDSSYKIAADIMACIGSTNSEVAVNTLDSMAEADRNKLIRFWLGNTVWKDEPVYSRNNSSFSNLLARPELSRWVNDAILSLDKKELKDLAESFAQVVLASPVFEQKVIRAVLSYKAAQRFLKEGIVHRENIKKLTPGMKLMMTHSDFGL